MPIWPQLLDSLSHTLPPERFSGLRLVLAVSGGADSVALLRLVHDLWSRVSASSANNLVVAHFNHGLRGEESDTDQKFIDSLSESLGVRFCTETAKKTDSLRLEMGEESLRTIRYGFLSQTAEREGARCVLVAHTADDNVETVLHHLFRGTGPTGLTGIPSHRSLSSDLVLRRPLLKIRRDLLREGLREIGQPWREDVSNGDPRYQRNWLRSALLPMIRERYPHIDDAILRLVKSQSEYCSKIDNDAAKWMDENTKIGRGSITMARGVVDPAIFSAAIRLLWRRLDWPRQGMTANHIHQTLAAVTLASNRSFTLPGDIQCQVEKAEVTLIRNSLSHPVATE